MVRVPFAAYLTSSHQLHQHRHHLVVTATTTTTTAIMVVVISTIMFIIIISIGTVVIASTFLLSPFVLQSPTIIITVIIIIINIITVTASMFLSSYHHHRHHPFQPSASSLRGCPHDPDLDYMHVWLRDRDHQKHRMNCIASAINEIFTNFVKHAVFLCWHYDERRAQKLYFDSDSCTHAGDDP